MKKWMGIGLILLLPLVLVAGCWDRREAEELLLLDALAFDLVMTDGEPNYQITFISTKPAGGDGQMGMAEEGGGGASVQWIASSQGRTLHEAILNFLTRAPRYLFLQHNALVIIGEDMARDGVAEILDFLVRKQGIRLRNFVFITRGNALDLFSAVPEFELTLAQELAALLVRGSRQADYYHEIDLNLFSQAVLTPGLDPWAPVIILFQPRETEENLAAEAIRLEGTGLFRADKLVGFLSKEETQGFLILRGLGERGGYFIRTGGDPVISFVYENVQVSRQLVVKDNKLEVNFEVTLEGILAEAHIDTRFREQDMDELEAIITRTAQDNLELTIGRLQQLGVDVLGIGRQIHAQKPKIWGEYRGNWEKIYQDMKINVTVNVEITETGLGFKTITANGEE